MKEIKIYVWWSSGKGDGDGYEDTIEVTDEQFKILSEIDAFEKELDSIKDPRIKKDCIKWYNEIIDGLFQDSMSGERESYEEDCLIDPDSDDYDPDGEEEQYTMSEREWWEETYNVGVRIDEEF